MGNRILLDIDNTMTTSQVIINRMADMFGKEYITNDDLHSYTLGDAFGLTPEENQAFWDLLGYEVLESSLPNISLIKNVYKNIIGTDDEIYIMTARPHEYRFITEKWLATYGIPLTELILVGDNSKVGLIERYDINIVIDDNPILFEELEVVKELFPNSNIARHMKNGTMKRYVVDYPYNRDVVAEFRLNEKGEVISDGNENSGDVGETKVYLPAIIK